MYVHIYKQVYKRGIYFTNLNMFFFDHNQYNTQIVQ